jgi:predicted RNA binding protein YcfA (HicA-like mRNA interferase family)
MPNSISKTCREIERLGWSAERTRGGHLRCSHPLAAYPVFAAGTPSDHRAWKNFQAHLKRSLAAGTSTATKASVA